MKKSRKLIALLLVVCLVVTSLLVACKPTCNICVDFNGDGKCDNCGNDMPEKPSCTEHVDFNNDGKCDNCGADVSENVCTTHVDTNNDGKCDNCGAEISKGIEVTVTASKTTINFDETLALTVTVKNAQDSSYTWSFSKEGIVKVENNILSVIAENLVVDQYVVVTATSNQDKSKSGSIAITIKVPTVEGQVGELTSEMIQELGNASITVSGIATDKYIDYTTPYNSYDTMYDMQVKMSEGQWVGTWGSHNGTDSITDHYRKGTDIVTNEYGEQGEAIEKVHLDKNNQVAYTQQKNYADIPAIWASQHLWNHLGSFNVNKFVYDAENEVYQYTYDKTNVDELYFLTYLTYSLTPMLTETLYEVYFVIENGVITKLIAQTEPIYYPEGAEEPDAMSYTIIELTFSDIGSTEIEQPKAYEAGENTDVLTAALEKMKAAKNYSFHSVETQLAGPVGDSGDYEISATMSVAKMALGDVQTATGTVGLQGWVTEGEILLCRTTKYSYAMDDRLYRLEYYGYKQTGENAYDEFDYDSTNGVYYGIRKYVGNIFDKMPSFEFSPNLFKCTGEAVVNGVVGKKFVLQEESISRSIAMELGLYYADTSTSSLYSNLEIVATEDGILSVKYPYSLSSGYEGYITTTFSHMGTTTMPVEGVFDGYVERVVPQTWDGTMTQHYRPDCSANESMTVNSSIAFNDVYGDKYTNSQFPQYIVFFNVFGDRVYGPFFNFSENGTDADGNTLWKKNISVTVQLELPEGNTHITPEIYDEVVAKLTEELGAIGFVIDYANSDMSGGAYGYSDKVVTFINAELGIQVVVDNNRTRYFWIDIYNMGDFQLNK